jgi:ABC-type lipoprotein export system ATPase subunit
VRRHLTLAWQLRAGTVDDDGCDALAEVTGLDQLADRRPKDLSVGQQQRRAFAAAVAANPSLVIADEPSAELDADETEALVALMPRLAAAGQTFVVASHDPAVLAVADTVFVMRAGGLAAQFASGGEFLALVDATGRVALPDEALELFPERRASLSVVEGEVRIRPS